MDEADDLSPSLAAPTHEDLAPTLGTAGTPPRGRAWWRSLKGPIAVLLGDLEATSPLVRRRAAEALVRLGDRRAVGPLTLAMRDPAWEVRRAVVRALGRLGGDGARAALRHAVRDGHPQVRLTAAEALAGLRDREAMPMLEDLARHMASYGTRFEQARVQAAMALLR